MAKIESNTLPQEYRNIFDELIMPVNSTATLESVILSNENRQKVTQFIRENKFAKDIIAHGLSPKNKILMYGASGCGKTYLTQALSNYLDYTLLTIDIAKALSEGTVAKNISNIFKLANYLGTCIIFLDECDAIAWNRDREGGDVARRATNSIFQYVDNMNPSNLFVSATNMRHRLDVAFERRFNVKMMFERPKMDLKDSIKRFTKPSFVFIDDVDDTTCTIVSKRALMSYYEIQDCVEEAMKEAIMDRTMQIKTSTIFKTIALAQNIKLKFGTHIDNSAIFERPIDEVNI